MNHSNEIRTLISTALLLVAGSTFSATIGSVASGWIDLDGGVSFFKTPEELCGPGNVLYEADWEITCSGSKNSGAYGVLAYACPPQYLPKGYPKYNWELPHLGASSGFGVAENGYVYLGEGPGDATACYNNTTAQLQLTLAGFSELRPANTGGVSTAEITAKVTSGGQPKPGIVVGFGVTVLPRTGGHAHGDGGTLQRPRGSLSKTSAVTDANGEIRLTFTAPAPAGNHVVTANCAPAGCSNEAKHQITVRVPGLVAIPADTQTPARYVLVGQLAQHPNSHNLTAAALGMLSDIVDTFRSLGWGQVGINDASLEWGGMFDIEGRWLQSYINNRGQSVTGGHAEHRNGEQVDISFNRPVGVPATMRRRAYDEVCTNNRTALSPDILWHQTDGYAPHFHIYLTGRGGNSPTGQNNQCTTK